MTTYKALNMKVYEDGAQEKDFLGEDVLAVCSVCINKAVVIHGIKIAQRKGKEFVVVPRFFITFMNADDYINFVQPVIEEYERLTTSYNKDATVSLN